MTDCGCLGLNCCNPSPDYVGDVVEFHEVYDVPIGTSEFEDFERRQLRMRLIAEEWNELLRASSRDDKVEFLDALVDMTYVILGATTEFGWDFNEAWRRVHESNLSKLDEDGNPIVRADGKILKGPNFKPPELGDLV